MTESLDAISRYVMIDGAFEYPNTAKHNSFPIMEQNAHFFQKSKTRKPTHIQS